MKTICLLIASQVNTGFTPPNHVATLAKERVRAQWEEANPDWQVKFDNKDCPVLGQYEFTENGLVIRGTENILQTPWTASIDDLLDGRSIQRPQLNLESPSIEPAKNKIPNWIWWAGGILTTGLASYWLLRSNSSTNTPQPTAAQAPQSPQKPTKLK